MKRLGTIVAVVVLATAALAQQGVADRFVLVTPQAQSGEESAVTTPASPYLIGRCEVTWEELAQVYS